MKKHPKKNSQNKQGPIPGCLEHRVGFFLNRLGRTIWEQTWAGLQELKVNPRHMGLMEIIEEGEFATQKEIGDRLFIDRTSMVAHIDYLEKLALVQRTVPAEDRRAYALKLTEKGKKTMKKARNFALKVQKQFLSSLSQTEQDTFFRLLRKVYLDQAQRNQIA
jgi:DNA-binding MarR family transcriptional regulator